MTKLEAAQRLRQIVQVWEQSIASMPPIMQLAQTTMCILRNEDIEAVRMAIETLRGSEVSGDG